MTATFILSFDCEGKWGVADRLSPRMHRDLSTRRLRDAYQRILGLLAEFKIPATFAFVGLFSQREGFLDRCAAETEELNIRHPGYFGAALRDIDNGSRDGWCGDWAVDMVQGSELRHEIALHGVTHIPWSNFTGEDLDLELSIYSKLEGPVARSQTMVYPRNDVAHVERLKDFGVKAFRGSNPSSRVVSLLNELNLFANPQRHSFPNEPLAIPSGHFVNWQSGLRRMIPRSLSKKRAENLLRSACKTGKVVHFWLHPENIASAPATLDRLRDILEVTKNAVDIGQCQVMKQIDYLQGIYNQKLHL